MVEIILLLVSAGGIVAFYLHDHREYQAFKKVETTAERQRYFRRWLPRSFALFFVFPVVALTARGETGALTAMPAVFRPLTAAINRQVEGGHLGSGFLLGFGASFLIGSLVISFVVVRRRRKMVPLGDIEALLPRNGRELGWATLLSLNAGLSEEVFFRLFLPFLLTLITGQPFWAFAAAALMFGLVHFYQGWIGIVASTVMGILLSLVYLGLQSLAPAIVLHALVDLNGLVLQPWLRLRQSPPPAP